jgi:hypothetical protein
MDLAQPPVQMTHSFKMPQHPQHKAPSPFPLTQLTHCTAYSATVDVAALVIWGDIASCSRLGVPAMMHDLGSEAVCPGSNFIHTRFVAGDTHEVCVGLSW